MINSDSESGNADDYVDDSLINAADEDDDFSDADEGDQRLDPKKRGLGRGLSALFEDEEDEDFGAPNAIDYDSALQGQASSTQLGLDQLEPGPYQPRQDMDEDALDELAASISVHGVLQPIIVRRKDGTAEQFEIIAGERRWRAAQRAQLHQVPVMVKDFSREEAFEVALIENLQREDLNAIEEAAGYQKLIEECDYTQEKLATEVGKSRSHVANMMRLLNLPQSVQAYVRDGRMSAGHARALVTCDHAEDLARRIVNEGLSVRETERLASAGAEARGKSKSSLKAAAQKDVDTLALEEEISNILGMKISIDMKGDKGAGSLKVNFSTLEQLDEVLHRLSHYPGSRQKG